MQPAGKYLGEDFHRAGGVPSMVSALLCEGLLPHPDAITVNGQSMSANSALRPSTNDDVISPAFRETYLSKPSDLNAFEGRVVVFDGPEG